MTAITLPHFVGWALLLALALVVIRAGLVFLGRNAAAH
jgi:hypothetical protein